MDSSSIGWLRDLWDYHDVILNWERTNACGKYLKEFWHNRRLGPILNINWVRETMKEINISLLQASGYGKDLQVVCCLFSSMDTQPLGFVEVDGVWLPVVMHIELGCESYAKIWFNEETKEKPGLFKLTDSEQLEVIPFELSSLPMIHGLLRCGVDPQFWCAMGLLHIGQLWWPVLCKEFKEWYFEEICKEVSRERRGPKVIYPAPKNTFAWTRFCGPTDIKVVILSQDPYPTENRATGLAFSMPKHKKITKSLDKIFQALKIDCGVERTDGDLIPWARQGVLLVNTSLTVREDEANSHEDIKWDILVRKVINHISREMIGVVFLLWGMSAQSLEGSIYNPPKRHLVLKAYHPAYNRQREDGQESSDLLVQNHFSRTNEFLLDHGKPGIDWSAMDFP